MREDRWSFWPSHTLIMFSNHRPRVQGHDEGIWRRLRLVPWPVIIPESERDRDLADKLRAEAPGILNWIIAGARRFLAEGFNPPDPVRTATATYREEEDHVGLFIADCLTIGADLWCTSSQIANEIEVWATDTGVEPPTMNDLAERLKTAGCTNKRQSIGGHRQTRWTGVGLRGPDAS